MSILSVDQIQPIGSGTTVTLNATELKTGTEITVGTGASIFSPAGNTLTFGTNNVERIRIKNDGKVGIGTDNPSNALDVQGGTTNTAIVARSTDAKAQISLVDNSTTSVGSVVVGAEGDNLFFTSGSSGVERLRINSDGKINVGGSGETTTGLLLLDKNITAESDEGDPNNYHLVIRSQSNSNTSKLGIGFANTSDDDKIGASILHHRTAGASVGDLAFYTSGSSGTTTERFNIASNGDVKVTSRGSNNSGAPFYVAVTGKSSVDYGGGNNDTACLRIVDNGSNNSYYHGIELRCKRDGDARIYAQDIGSDACDLVFAVDNSGLAERLRITSSGRLGINITNPQYLIHAKHNGQGGNQRIDLHMTNDTTGHGQGDGVQFGYQNSAGAYIWNFEDTDIYFGTTNVARLYIRKSTGHLEPSADNAQNLGSSSKRWANIYTGDLQLSNVTPSSNGGEPVGSGGNEVDGTEGTWTIQEGSNDLFIINRVNGKKYKFNLTEVT